MFLRKSFFWCCQLLAWNCKMKGHLLLETTAHLESLWLAGQLHQGLPQLNSRAQVFLWALESRLRTTSLHAWMPFAIVTRVASIELNVVRGGWRIIHTIIHVGAVKCSLCGQWTFFLVEFCMVLCHVLGKELWTIRSKIRGGWTRKCLALGLLAGSATEIGGRNDPLPLNLFGDRPTCLAHCTSALSVLFEMAQWHSISHFALLIPDGRHHWAILCGIELRRQTRDANLCSSFLWLDYGGNGEDTNRPSCHPDFELASRVSFLCTCPMCFGMLLPLLEIS